MAHQPCSAPFSSIRAAMLKMPTVSPAPRMMLTRQIVCREIGQYSVNCENLFGESCLICIALQTASLLLHYSNFPHCVANHRRRRSAHSMCMAWVRAGEGLCRVSIWSLEPIASRQRRSRPGLPVQRFCLGRRCLMPKRCQNGCWSDVQLLVKSPRQFIIL
jgi:hypothetical protein